MEKRFQVFVSSTYEDLREERLEVMRALLELDCIPCGMEYFPAASEDQWTFIKELIGTCDYYVVIVGGRYGSTDADGVSFTQREYEYALSLGIPTIAFVHSDIGSLPAGRTERSREGQRRLQTFIKLVQGKLCKEWTGPADLGAVVSRSITQLMKRVPRTGWVRGDVIAANASAELLTLTKRVQDLERELAIARRAPRRDTSHFAQGTDRITLRWSTVLQDNDKAWGAKGRSVPVRGELEVSWDDVISFVAPELVMEARETKIATGVQRLVRDRIYPKLMSKYTHHSFSVFNVAQDCVRAITLQLRALDVIDLSQRESNGKTVRFAKLTPYGESLLEEKSVIKRPLTSG